MLISFLLNFIGRWHTASGGRYCDVEQLAARLAHTQEVAGSSPAFATVIPHKTDLLAGQRRRARKKITPLERHPLPGCLLHYDGKYTVNKVFEAWYMEKRKPNIRKQDGAAHYFCPKCGNHILSTRNMSQSGKKVNYCPECGQGIDWTGISLETYWPQ